MKLTSEQFRVIEQEIEGHISISTLGEDLLDHLICAVESKLEGGVPFNSAWQSAVRELAPNGLGEIQKETMLLLNSNLLFMKKATFVIGLLSSMMMAAGWVMSILHLPGAGNFYTAGVASYGFLAFAGLYLPLAAIAHFKSNPSMPKFDRLKLIAGLSSGFIAIIAMVLKIMHIPGANITIVVGAALFVFWFLPALFFSMYKKSIA